MIAPLALLAPIKVIIDLLKPVLIFIHDTLGVSWGFSIVLLTVVVRALLAPLTVKQFKSMKAIADIAPHLKEVKEKYKDDKQRVQQETMKVYAEHKINPFASCLPLVAQLPFFIGLFYLLQTDLRNEICAQTAKPCGQIPGSSGEGFLFVPDLTAPAHGWVLIVLIVLYVGSQLLSSVLTPSTGDRNQRMIMYGLPFVFVFIIIRFPAGLIVYWITTNLWTVGQGYILRKKLGPIMPPQPQPAAAGGGGGGADGGGVGGFFARLTGAATAARPAPSPSPSPSADADGSGSKSRPRPAPSGGPPPRPPRKKKKRSGRRR
jgi:YidC/Oxa1 family membrane protein insertase